MLFRGNRRLVVLAAAGVVIAVIAIVVVLNNRDEHVYDKPVASSTLDDFETRGPLADHKDVVEAAADVWRKGDSYRAETKPSREIELLWAGEVEAAAVADLYVDDDRAKNAQVVILRSGDEVATFAATHAVKGADTDDDGFDGIGIEETRIYSSPLLEVPGNLVLTADTFPKSYTAVDETAIPVAARADDGLISSTHEGLALRLEATTSLKFSSRSAPGIFVNGRIVRFAPGDLDRVWSMLGNTYLTEPVRAGIGRLLDVPDGRPGAVLQLPEIEIVRESKAPGGRSLLVLTATGWGAASGSGGTTRTVAAVDYTADKKDDLSFVESLGRLDDVDSWVGSAWMTPEGAQPYFVVAGGDGAETIQVYLGRQSERLAAPGGVIVPDKAVRQDELPAVVVAGFTKNGGVVPTMPEE